MKAYELYLNDQVNGNEFVRCSASRKAYYEKLREALRDECEGGRLCEWLEKLGARMDAQKLPYMYLLDAAAVWECYETVVEGIRFMRPVNRFPFKVKGRDLLWDEVDSLSEKGELPVAVVEQELWNRLIALLNYGAGHGTLREKPPVNDRAALATADPDVLPAAEEAAEEPAPAVEPQAEQPAAPAVSAAEIEALRQEYEQQLKDLTQQAEVFRRENETLRGEAEQLRSYHELTREYAVKAANAILAGKTEEARAAASHLDEKLQAAAGELERVTAECRELENRITGTQEKLAVDRVQLNALRQQAAQAAQAVADVRSEREQAAQAAADALAQQQTARAELDAAQAQLNAETATLRGLRQRVAQTRKEGEMTRRQIDGLTENL